MYRLCFTLFLFFPVLSYGSSLREAEQSAIRNSYRLRGMTEQKSALDYREDQLNASFLPGLRMEYSAVHQTMPEQARTHQLSAEARVNLGNPMSFMAKKKQLDVRQDMLSEERSHETQTIMLKLRSAYFKAKFIEEQTEQSRRHLSTLETVLSITEKKYQQGRIPVSDKIRSDLEKIRQQQILESLELDYKGQKEHLALLTGDGAAPVTALSTRLPDSFDISFLPEDFQKTLPARRMEMEIRRSDASRSLKRSEYLPDVYLSYQRYSYGQDQSSAKGMIGLTWNLSSDSYFSSRAMDMEHRALLCDHKEELQKGRIDFREQLSRLKSLLTKMAVQKKMLRTYQEISKETLNQYHRGHISLRDYYEDVRAQISEEQALLLQRSEAVSLIAQLSFLMEDDTVFYRALKL